jgi:hypothetical protein
MHSSQERGLAYRSAHIAIWEPFRWDTEAAAACHRGTLAAALNRSLLGPSICFAGDENDTQVARRYRPQRLVVEPAVVFSGVLGVANSSIARAEAHEYWPFAVGKGYGPNVGPCAWNAPGGTRPGAITGG